MAPARGESPGLIRRVAPTARIHPRAATRARRTRTIFSLERGKKSRRRTSRDTESGQITCQTQADISLVNNRTRGPACALARDRIEDGHARRDRRDRDGMRTKNGFRDRRGQDEIEDGEWISRSPRSRRDRGRRMDFEIATVETG